MREAGVIRISALHGGSLAINETSVPKRPSLAVGDFILFAITGF